MLRRIVPAPGDLTLAKQLGHALGQDLRSECGAQVHARTPPAAAAHRPGVRADGLFISRPPLMHLGGPRKVARVMLTRRHDLQIDPVPWHHTRRQHPTLLMLDPPLKIRVDPRDHHIVDRLTHALLTFYCLRCPRHGRPFALRHLPYQRRRSGAKLRYVINASATDPCPQTSWQATRRRRPSSKRQRERRDRGAPAQNVSASAAIRA